MTRRKPNTARTTVRCAIYTRKSTEEGLDQEFNSLDAQRESAEAYIASQREEGWVALQDRYDDGGFSGGTIERPGLQRLISDIDAGKVDCVIVYKVDRLSRSLLDFTRIMASFERHGVAFVSVTQAFNTRDSMGRLMLNVLLSFAQFEREISGERIRDKIGAARRKGKWAGGRPILGYEVDRSGPSPRLVVNADEAERVRAIFDLYLEHGSLLPVVRELAGRGWCGKQLTTRSGKTLGGRPFDRPSLHSLLTNPLYIGMTVHKDEQFQGEHAAIVDADLFAQVRKRMNGNARCCGAEPTDGSGGLLRGLIRCAGCGCAMVHTLAGRRAARYRYYICSKANRTSRRDCACPSLPAAEIERAVVDDLHGIVNAPEMLRETLNAARDAKAAAIAKLVSERSTLDRRSRSLDAKLRSAVTEPSSVERTDRIAALGDEQRRIETRRAEIDVEIAALEADRISETEVADAFADFGTLWESLTPAEQQQLFRTLIERVEFDPADSSLEIRFHAIGIRTLADGRLAAR